MGGGGGGGGCREKERIHTYMSFIWSLIQQIVYQLFQITKITNNNNSKPYMVNISMVNTALRRRCRVHSISFFLCLLVLRGHGIVSKVGGGGGGGGAGVVVTVI